MLRVGIFAAGLAALVVLSGPAVAGAPFFSFEVRFPSTVSQPLTDARAETLLEHTSPDGEHDAEWSGGTLTVANANGTSNRAVAHVAGRILFATWSPDGRQLAFETLVEETCPGGVGVCTRYQVWSARANGSAQHLVRDGAAQPAWAPDSRHLAFVDDFEVATFTGTLATAADDGSDFRTLRTGASVFAPAWSPDGRWIAYRSATRRRGEARLVAVATDGTPTQRDLGAGTAALWAPDSQRLAIVRPLRHRREELVIRALSTGGDVPVVIAQDVGPLTWSHTGSRLAFALRRRGVASVTIVDATGGDRSTVSPPRPWQRGDVVELAWARDDAALYYSMRLATLKRPR